MAASQTAVSGMWLRQVPRVAQPAETCAPPSSPARPASDLCQRIARSERAPRDARPPRARARARAHDGPRMHSAQQRAWPGSPHTRSQAAAAPRLVSTRAAGVRARLLWRPPQQRARAARGQHGTAQQSWRCTPRRRCACGRGAVRLRAPMPHLCHSAATLVTLSQHTRWPALVGSLLIFFS